MFKTIQSQSTKVATFARSTTRVNRLSPFSTSAARGYKYPTFGGNLLVVGWGTVAQASLPLILNDLKIAPPKITVITADDKGKEVAAKHGIKHIIQPLDFKNSSKILSSYLNYGDFLLNLSVDVSSVELASLALQRGAIYMDTCVEPAAGGYSEGSLGDRTNYMQRERAMALKPKFPRGSPTALFAHGINPGLISSILKQALVNIANDTKLEGFKVPTTRDEWAHLMHRLGVKVIHVAERDTQVTKDAKRAGEFYNTWSVDGFISEGVFQAAELGWGSHEKELPHDAHQQTQGSKAAIYLGRPGAATKVRTWTPIEKNFHGFLVTHNEAISIAEYFSVYGAKGDVQFRPTVHYAYHPCDAAITSVHEILGKDAVKQPVTKVIMDEVVSGHDELGVLVMGHKNVSYWYGSVLDVHTARKLAPYNNATSLQVAAGVLAGMTHCIESPRDGVIEAEDLDHTKAIASALPYLGKMVGEYSDWTPIKNYDSLFPRPVDLNDPWQFKNFRVY